MDFKAGVVTLDPGSTKNGRCRIFPFNELPELAELLKTLKSDTEILERQAATIIPAVFHRNGTRIASFNGAWRTAVKAAGCPGRIVHDMRRTAVRNLVRAGVPEQMAMRLTGDLTRSVFERYNVTTGTDLRTAVKQLALTSQGRSTSAAS